MISSGCKNPISFFWLCFFGIDRIDSAIFRFRGYIKRIIFANDFNAARRWFRVLAVLWRSDSSQFRKAKIKSEDRCSGLRESILTP